MQSFKIFKSFLKSLQFLSFSLSRQPRNLSISYLKNEAVRNMRSRLEVQTIILFEDFNIFFSLHK